MCVCVFGGICTFHTDPTNGETFKPTPRIFKISVVFSMGRKTSLRDRRRHSRRMWSDLREEDLVLYYVTEERLITM